VRGCEYVDGHIYFTMAKKSKDPAFLFYTSDFLTGTLFMSNEQVGVYIRLLCAQHQHGGLIDKNSFNGMVKEDSVLRSKFVETEDGFYNERLMEEMVLRQKKTTNLSANAQKRWSKVQNDAKAMQLHINNDANALQLNMPIEDENEDVNLDVNNKIGGVGERPNYTPSLDNQHIEVDQLKPILMQRTSWRDIQQRNGKYTDEQFEVTVNAFIEWLKEKGELTKTPKDARFHYNNFAKRKRSEKTVVKAPAYKKLD
jgi:uncharacterized protein YdaU (DUF1376 family)